MELIKKVIQFIWPVSYTHLDVYKRQEDQSRKRDENAAQNFSILLKIALNLLKNEKTAKVGVKGKRLKAGWDNQYLEKLIKL